jgi:hypothetical protein
MVTATNTEFLSRVKGDLMLMSASDDVGHPDYFAPRECTTSSNWTKLCLEADIEYDR